MPQIPHLELNVGGRKVVLYFNEYITVGSWTDYYCNLVDSERQLLEYTKKTIVIFGSTADEDEDLAEAMQTNGAKILSALLYTDMHFVIRYLPDPVKELTEQINTFIKEELQSGKQEVPKRYT